MPRSDPPGPGKGLKISRMSRWRPPPRKRPRKGGEAEREPVEPPNPKLLSGGAAAELEFDD